MKDEKELNAPAAGQYANAARLRAGSYSDQYRITYTARERARIETMTDIVQMAYRADTSYLNFRKTMAVIKLVGAQIRSRQEVRDLEAICEERGYERVRTAQGLLIRMPRKALGF
jgi:hypothetical protein